MKLGWLLLTIVALLFVGCTAKSEPTKSPATLPKGEGRVRPALPKGVERADRIDDFGLPLDIYLEVPEVPEEIMGPSPPIVEKPDVKKK